MEGLELKSNRLHLRPMRDDDVDRIVEFLSDLEVSKWLARVQHPYERSHALDWVARNRAARPVDQTGFALDAGQGLIGSIGFHLIEDIPNVGYWLAKPFWGLGFMSEAASATLARLFEMTDHEVVTSGVFEGNAASLRIQEKLGFKITDTGMQHNLAQGKDMPHIHTLLHRNQFRPLAS